MSSNAMILNVKLLSGGGSAIDVEARESDSVESLKRQIEEKLKLSSGTEQKLLFKGKTLQGELTGMRCILGFGRNELHSL